MPSTSEAGSNTKLAERVKSILASKDLSLHKASQGSGNSLADRHLITYPTTSITISAMGASARACFKCLR